MGDNLCPTFLLGAVYNQKQRISARVEFACVIRWCEIRIEPSRRSVLSAFRLFFTGDSRKLMKQFRTYRLHEKDETRRPLLFMAAVGRDPTSGRSGGGQSIWKPGTSEPDHGISSSRTEGRDG